MNKSIKLTINGKVVSIKAGTKLSEILSIEKPCGGKGTCGKCKVKVNGEEVLACQYTVTSDITVETCEVPEIVSETGAEEGALPTDNLCLALDIGTTTLAMALVSRDEKKAIQVITATNPQRVFGADVMTRINACRKHSVQPLHDVLIAEINRMIAMLGAEAETMYVSANVTMLHTLFGVDCTSIGVSPYTPAFLEGKHESAQSIGLRGVKNIVSLPSIASFVGADVVAGLYRIGIPQDGKYHMLIDLGTNAEIVLYSNRSGIATSAAAGPCFEGANISCGMSATKGAIDSFSLNYGHASYQTIGNEVPKGICGTGLIDVVAELLKNGIMDETGYMEQDYPLADGVHLSREDVRQYQLAKSAIYSAILTLMKMEKIGFDDIAALYLSGGFSSKIQIQNATATGLLPQSLAHKTVTLNNSSLQGTLAYACDGGDLNFFTNRISYVDLAADSYFAEQFITNMTFDVK